MTPAPALPAVRFVAWSDYLCPWCANASLRLQRVEDEYPEIAIEWRSYLLRPAQRPAPASELEAAERIEKFRHYARSWERPAQEPDAARFRLWQSETLPPTHSLPAQVAAKAAARLGRGAFRALHQRLMRAYFEENRDISAEAELRALWRELELPEEGFAPLDDPALVAAVVGDHNDALERGATGVPAVMLVGNDAVVVGAPPLETYRSWVERSLERALRSTGGGQED
jgi:predicted DsbA family dithiol-disulfide isomerase